MTSSQDHKLKNSLRKGSIIKRAATRSYSIAQGMISNILGQTMMKKNINKYTHTHTHIYTMCIYVYIHIYIYGM